MHKYSKTNQKQVHCTLEQLNKNFLNQEFKDRTSPVAQWLRIRLPIQGTWVRALVREDPTCHGAAKSVHHNYWACALEPASHNYWAHVPQLLKPVRLEPVLHCRRSHCNEEYPATRESPCTATKTSAKNK